MDKLKLKNQIWTTRVSRVNAEKRLLHNENLVQGINIYYSCYLVISSITLLLVKDDLFAIVSTFMSVCLLIIVLYFKSLRYTERAFDFRRIYTELQKLEFILDTIEEDPGKMEQIYQKYCDLLSEGENHISYDYYRTIWQSKPKFRKKRLNRAITVGYIWGKTWRAMLTLVVILVPLILTAFCFIIKKYGISL